MLNPAFAMLAAEALPLREDLERVAHSLDPAGWEDLVQETYLRALKGADGYKAGTDCRQWLLAILRNAWIDAHRRLRPAVCDTGAMAESLAAPAHEAVEMEWTDERLKRAVQALPDCYREAFELVVIGGHSYGDAARLLGIPPGTVGPRVFRACQHLKGALAVIARNN